MLLLLFIINIIIIIKISDIETCFKYVKYYNGKNRFIFIGDSRIKQIYQSFLKRLDKSVEKTPRHVLSSSENLNYTNKNLNLEAVCIFNKNNWFTLKKNNYCFLFRFFSENLLFNKKKKILISYKFSISFGNQL